LHEHDKARFEQAVLPHLSAAFRLARWLTRSDHDAEEVVQEAYLRACRFFGRFHGEDGRGWLLAVVRNTAYTFLKRHRLDRLRIPFDEQRHDSGVLAMNPERLFLQKATAELLREALEELPAAYREAVILRDLEGFSYKEIAAITGVPMGTVMSRLTRGRERLQRVLGATQGYGRGKSADVTGPHGAAAGLT
jgi:RNA polymerase sigma-70 factor (ECF subfamily)